MNVILKTDSLILTFASENGALIDLVVPKTNWQIMRRANLGVPFRMLVPISDTLRNNPVYRADDGSEGMVICNFGEEEIECTPSLDRSKLRRYRLVDGEEWLPLSDKCTLPPRCAAILL